MDIEKCVANQFWNAYHSSIIISITIAIGILLIVAYIKYVNKNSVKWVVASLVVLAFALSASVAAKAATSMYLAYSCSGALK